MEKPRVSSSSSRPRKFWKLDMLAEVAIRELKKMDMLASKEEAEPRDVSIFVQVPRKKRSLPHRMIQTRNPNLENDQESKKRRFKEEEMRSHKKRKTFRRFELLSIPSTTIPEWLVNVMSREENAYDPKPIIAKKLYMSDLDNVQGRLSMPLRQVVSSDFLNEVETRIIYEQSVLRTHKEGVSVVLVDPRLNKHKVDLRKWKMSSDWNYVLVDGWNDVVAKNKFQIEDVFLVWSFRSGDGKLCFALIPPARNYGHSGGYTTGEFSHGDSLP